MVVMIPDLIQCEQQGWVESGCGGARGDTTCGFDEIFHERGDQGGGVVRPGTRG
jgi:hypothetical protein